MAALLLADVAQGLPEGLGQLLESLHVRNVDDLVLNQVSGGLRDKRRCFTRGPGCAGPPAPGSPAWRIAASLFERLMFHNLGFLDNAGLDSSADFVDSSHVY